MEDMSISENDRGCLVTISLAEEEVEWLMDACADFYWMKGERYGECLWLGRCENLKLFY